MTGRRWAGRVLRLLPLGWGYACGEFLKAVPMTHMQMWQFGALAASAWLIGMALMWQLLHDRQRLPERRPPAELPSGPPVGPH